MVRALLVFAIVCPLAARAEPPHDESHLFTPTAATDLRLLLDLVARRSPLLHDQALVADLAAADLHQSELLENPTLDGGAGTLPVGGTNPAGHPAAEVPNYNVGLGYHFEIAKRGPRQARARALLAAARLQLRSATRAEALRLATALGALAVSTLRLDGARSLVDQARGSLDIAKSRVAAGFGSPIEVDRVEIDLYRLEQQVFSDEGEETADLAACAAVIGMPCRRFPSSGDARAFLDRWLAAAREAAQTPGAPLEERADLRALAAGRDGARDEARLARAHAIPDPSLRVGYTYDTFVVSGNQRNSLSLWLTLPLPLFDHGQAALEAAEARRHHLGAQLTRSLEAARARVTTLRDSLAAQLKRQQVLRAQMLPRAHAVLASLEHAFAARAIALGDVISARRTVAELQLAEADSLSDGFRAAIELLGQLPEGGRE